MRSRGLRVTGGFATHAHWDHVLWHASFGDVPRWSTPTTAALADHHRVDLLDQARAVTTVDESRFAVLTPVPDGPLPWPARRVEVVTHHAHQPGQAALFVADVGALVAGDMLSDTEVPLLATDIPGPAAALTYLAGLQRVLACEPTSVVVPGHGSPTDSGGLGIRVHADRLYLDDLMAGRERYDQRLATAWLADADTAQAEALSKREWRAWVRTLPEPGSPTAVCAHLADFVLGHERRDFGRAGPPRTGGRMRVAAYHALPGEVDLAPLVDALGDRVVLCLPRMHGARVSWHEADGVLEAHRLGVLQPTVAAVEVAPADLDVVLVPGRLFDIHGIRLGRGGGHYDRLLPGLRTGVPAIGVTTGDRVVPRLPTEAHDVAMSHLATESGVVEIPR